MLMCFSSKSHVTVGYAYMLFLFLFFLPVAIRFSDLSVCALLAHVNVCVRQSF